MTHVFVAPHPDDAALSCGGLIASLRELGQNVTILTVFSGDGAAATASTGYQREALGSGRRRCGRSTEAFNRAHIGADEPVYAPDALPAWAATDEPLEATQADADAAAKRFWQRSSWYRRASIRAESLAGQPLIDDLPTQGAVLTGERVDDGGRRRPHGQAAPRGRAVRALRRGVDRLPRPARTPSSAATRATTSCSARRATTTTPYETLRREIDRLEPQKVYLPLGVGNHVDHQLCRDVGVRLLPRAAPLGDAGPGVRRASSRSTRTSRTPGGGLLASSTDLPADALADSRRTSPWRPSTPTSRDQLERKIRGITHLREPDRAAVRRDEGDGPSGAGARAEGGAARRDGRRGRALLVDAAGLSAGYRPGAICQAVAARSGGTRAVPVQVVRKPLAELEVALAGSPVAPRRRDLGDPAAGQRRLDRELQGQLEAGRALDRRSTSRKRRAVELEVVRRVVGRRRRRTSGASGPPSGSSGA